jgi:hypothetical protein
VTARARRARAACHRPDLESRITAGSIASFACTPSVLHARSWRFAEAARTCCGVRASGASPQWATALTFRARDRSAPRMCINCRRDPTVYARDPCVAKFENGAGRSHCYGPNDTRGIQCVTCTGKPDKRKLPEGSARSRGGKVRSASQLAKCPGCGREVKACRKAHRENKAPRGKLEICQACF